MMAVDWMSRPVLSTHCRKAAALVSRSSWRFAERINIATERIMATSGGDIPSTNDPTSASGASNSEQPNANANFECNICLDTAKDAVISFCGHLFWWEFWVFRQLDKTRIHGCFTCDDALVVPFHTYILTYLFIFFLAGHVFTRFVGYFITLSCCNTKKRSVLKI